MDASIGYGHFSRCLSMIATQKAKGYRCVYACRNANAHERQQIAFYGGDILLLGERAFVANALIEAFPQGVDGVVIDSYLTGIEYERELFGWSRVLCVIDDLANRKHKANFLVDRTFGRSAGEYRGLVESDCRLLMGSDYVLLRPEFIESRKRVMPARRKVKYIPNVLLSIGATDPGNFSEKLIRALKGFTSEFELDVVLSSRGSSLERIRNLLGRMSTCNIKLHIDLNAHQLCDLINKSHCAIAAGGVSAWERACLGLPSLVVEVNESQRDLIAGLERCGAVKRFKSIYGDDYSAIRDEFTDFVENRTLLNRMSRDAQKISSGKGAELVCSALTSG